MTQSELSAHAEHFHDGAQRDAALRLGTTIFLVSESLLFAGLIGIYFGVWSGHGAAFTDGTTHNLGWVGAAGTGVLLVSSGLIAIAVSLLAADKRRGATWCTALTAVLGSGFLVCKGIEYADHIRHGILPGGYGDFFVEHTDVALVAFFNCYWLTTGLHAAHVLVGVGMLGFAAWRLARGRWGPQQLIILDCFALYWHFVDLVWIFLWPMYYGFGGGT